MIPFEKVLVLRGHHKLGDQVSVWVEGGPKIYEVIERLPAFPCPPCGGNYYVVRRSVEHER